MPPTGPVREIDWIVPQNTPPMRIDRLVAATIGTLSRSQARSLIEQGNVTVDGAVESSPSALARPDVRIAVRIPPPPPADPRPALLPLDIAYEDEHLIVINKPPGLVVHPAPGRRGDTLVDALLAHCGDRLSGIGGGTRPGIVHRLDRDTSGLLVAAKTDESHIRLAAAISAREVKRIYQAVCWGLPVPRTGRIERPIGRHPRHRTRMAVVAQGGRTADTHYRTRFDVGGKVSLLECRLGTGRTHQIRVHLASAGCPLIGDTLYCRARTPSASLGPALRTSLRAFPRQALHAHRLAFLHPVTGVPLRLTAAPPRDLGILLQTLQAARHDEPASLARTAPERHL